MSDLKTNKKSGKKMNWYVVQNCHEENVDGRDQQNL